MANHVSHGSLPYPIKNARYTILVAYLDADGDPTDPTTPDTEVSQDGGAFADAAEEMTTISGSNGMGYITLTGAETNNSIVGVAAKVASGPKNTLATLYPRNLPILESGTAQAGAAGSITLASNAPAYDITNCFIRTTGGTGGGGTGGANNQARRITAYNTSTKVATVTPNWETTPDSTTTYDVLCPEGVTPSMLKTLIPTTFGRTLDVSTGGEAGLDWSNVGSPTATVVLSGTTVKTATDVETDTQDIQARLPTALVSGRIDASVGAMAANVVTASAIATDAITAGKIAADAIGASELAADAVAEIADQVWDEAISGHLGAGSTGEKLNSAGSAGDPWATSLPGSYGTGTAGKIVGDNLNATVSSRASQASLDTLDDYVDTEIAAIKAKTDQLTFTNTNKVDASLLAVADLAAAVANKIADHVLRRTYANARASSDGDTITFRSLLGAISKLVNKWTISGSTLTMYHEDDSTSFGTQAVTGTAGADPITTLDTN